jgi:hypothetical protein
MPPAATLPYTWRTFTKSCDGVWPVALRVAQDAGWKVETFYRGSAISSPSGTIKFAVGATDCDVLVQTEPEDSSFRTRCRTPLRLA